MHEFEVRLRKARPSPPCDSEAHDTARQTLRSAVDQGRESKRRHGKLSPRVLIPALAAVLLCGTAIAVVSQTEVISSGGQASAPEAGAVSATGQVSVWTEEVAGADRVVAAISDEDGRILRRDVLAPEGAFPSVAETGSGSAVVAWITSNGIWSSSLSRGGWSNPTAIPGTEGSAAVKLRLDYGASGRVYASWEQQGPPEQALTASFTDGTWTVAEMLPRPPGASSFAPMLAESADGTTMAVWQSLNRTEASIFASQKTRAGWSAPTLLTTARSAGSPDAAFDGAGRAYVVWNEITTEGAPSITVYRYWDPTSGWSAVRNLTTIGSATASPQVVGHAAGATIAWADGPEGRASVRIATVTPSGALATSVVSDSSGPGISIAMTPAGDGDTFVVWTRRPMADSSVLETAMVDSTASRTSFVAVPTDGFPLLPSATVTPRGERLVLWTEIDGDRSVVKSLRLAP